ncbi:beta-mannosidase [Nocardia sp. CDC160]|uniref:beta-mannosidase n=1 Tax=Nocardia sp. CDC160 TaxID=3112166 RepID=UPI002DB5AB1A|nr:beta-mannosidase [Nocardia sp. CDC160]MEC3920022.1 beta-mannosidase [Nocardia sp. CDC160]
MATIGRLRCLVGIFAVGLLTGCGSSQPHHVVTTSLPQQPSASAPAAPAAVTASPNGLLLHGQPWWPAGFNGPQLPTDYSVNFGCGAQVDLDAFFAKVPEHALIRFPLFQAFAVNKNSSALDFGPTDRVFAAAEKYGRLLLPVLAAQSGDCGDEVFKQRQWYVDGWKTTSHVPGRAVMSFQDWVRTAVDRWRGSPVVAGWELVGEPEPSVCRGTQCDLRFRTCPNDSQQVLRTFMDEAGKDVRALDPHRLIFAGYVGGSQCGTAGDAFSYVSASPNIDVVEFHDYNEDGVPLPGGPNNGLARRLTQSRDLGKPLLVAEIGEYAGSCETLDDRRDSLARRIDGQRQAGTAGALFWAFVPDPRPDQCTYDIGPDDPLWGLVAERTTVG